MTSVNLGIIVEGLVALLLVLTIIYCATLNARLKLLRADETTLRSVITELMMATESAERAIYSLKDTAAECDQTLAQRLREAERFSVDIAREIQEGDRILARIAQITRTVRPSPNVEHEAMAAVQASLAPIAPPMQPSIAAPVAQPRPASPSTDDLRARAAQMTDRLAVLRRGGGEWAA